MEPDLPDRTTVTPRGISERFRAVAAELAGPSSAVELLPNHLAEVARRVLPCDGAGLSVLSQEFRVPLGATDEESALVERLQFTAEQGPCWDAVRADVAIAADGPDIEARWPQFHTEIRDHASFRSVVSVPVRLARGVGGALDLYFRDPFAARGFDLDDGTVVAAHIADRLNRADASGRRPHPSGVSGPAWARGRAARGRLAVWIASGMVMSRSVSTADDALALLRAAAYSAGRTLDDVASDLVEGRIGVDDMAG